MEHSILISIFSLSITAISVITGFVLQIDRKKLKNLEGDVQKYKSRLNETTEAISGYHFIEDCEAKSSSMTVDLYRKHIRKRNGAKGYKFPTPSRLKEIKQEII